MKTNRALLVILTIATCLVTVPAKPATQSVATYQQMTQPQRSAFVAEQARRIARAMSGRAYEFTPEFDAAIQRAVDSYVRRIGNSGNDQSGKSDARFIFERGQTHAPTLNGIFKARGLSPLFGLYIPVVESEFKNLSSSNPAGSIGMFQFVPKTGEHFGLSPADLMDVPKSADAAARYIAASLKQFDSDPMKEALALLAYNRGGDGVARDVAMLVNEQNRACSICVLTEQRDKLDASFQNESVYYVPRFFAAAIIGENPQAFGMKNPPLSSL